MLDFNNAEIKFMRQVITQASELAVQIQSELVTPALTKDDRSPVTVADYAVQALVARLLSQTFPNDPLIAEEDAAILSQANQANTLQIVTSYINRFVATAPPTEICKWIDRGRGKPLRRFWTLDPIDGTKGFLRGDQYVIALALIIDGQVQVGALGCPKLDKGYLPNQKGEGSLVIAARSQGAWVGQLFKTGQLTKIKISSCQIPAEARLLRSFEEGHTDVEKTDRFIRIIGTNAEPIKMDSQAKYAVLACGQADLVMRLLSPAKPNYREKIWDQASGSVIVEEAGGRITDLHGNVLNFSQGRTLTNNRGILASNGSLHSYALAALAAIGA